MTPNRKFTLKVLSGPQKNQAFLFDQETVCIGSRYAKNDLIMNLEGISALHAKIWHQNHHYYVQNLSDNQFNVGDGISLAINETCEIKSKSKIDMGAVQLKILIKDEKSSAGQKKTSGVSETNGAQRPNRLLSRIKSRRALRIGGPALIAMIALLMVVNLLNTNKNTKAGTKPYPAVSSEEPIALPAKGIYGYTQNKDKSHPDKAVFTFKPNLSNIELYYTAGGIDTENEVSLNLNGQLVGYAPLAKGAWGEETVVRLPKQFILEGETNQLVFDSTENPPNFNQWAVRNIWVKELAMNLCDVEKARKLFDLGEEMYEQKTISKGNLYMAFRYYSDSLSLIQDCSKDVLILEQAESKKERCLQELDELYNSLRFALKKANTTSNYGKCRDILQSIVMHFPDKSDDRHKEAAEYLEEYNRYLQMQPK